MCGASRSWEVFRAKVVLPEPIVPTTEIRRCKSCWLLGICLRTPTWLKLWGSRALPSDCGRPARTVLSASAGVSSPRATGLMRFWFLFSKNQRPNLFYVLAEHSSRASWDAGGAGSEGELSELEREPPI